MNHGSIFVWLSGSVPDFYLGREPNPDPVKAGLNSLYRQTQKTLYAYASHSKHSSVACAGQAHSPAVGTENIIA